MIAFEPVSGSPPWLTPSLAAVPGHGEFARRFAGARTEGGLYRVHDARSGAIASQAIPVAFPDFTGYTAVFGQDWLGRQFGFAPDQEVDGGPQVLLFELSTGSVLELPFGLDSFHAAYDEIREPAFAVGLFDSWSEAHPETLPLAGDRCIGFRQPLFLGGEEAISNLEESDLDVYLSLTAQLWRQVRDLPDGTALSASTTP